MMWQSGKHPDEETALEFTFHHVPSVDYEPYHGKKQRNVPPRPKRKRKPKGAKTHRK